MTAHPNRVDEARILVRSAQQCHLICPGLRRFRLLRLALELRQCLERVRNGFAKIRSGKVTNGLRKLAGRTRQICPQC